MCATVWNFTLRFHVYDRARELCAGCTVVETCRVVNDRAERDLPAGMLFGFFAGETPAERVRRRTVEGSRATVRATVEPS